MVKQKISGLCVAFALVLLMCSVVFPHHHHGNTLCFNTKCVEKCCHHHEDEAEESGGIASHHHNHTSDEIVLYAPYTLAEHPRIISEPAADSHSLFVTVDCDIPSLLRVETPAVGWLSTDPGGTVPRTVAGSPSRNGRRGPPVA